MEANGKVRSIRALRPSSLGRAIALSGLVILVGYGLTLQPAWGASAWTKAMISSLYVPGTEATHFTNATITSFKNLQKLSSFLAGHASGKLKRDLLALSRTTHTLWTTPATASAKTLQAVAIRQVKADKTVATDLGVEAKVAAFIKAHQRAPAAPTTTTITTPAQTQAAFEASCQSLPYAELANDPDSLSGTPVTYQALVFQYDSNTGPELMLVDVDTDGAGDWSDPVEIDLPSAAFGSSVSENDVIQVWGTVDGTDTYSVQGGGTTTVPIVDAMYLSIISTG